MNKAEKEILRHVQRESLKEEIAILQATGSGVGDVARTRKGQINKSSRVSKLDPWLMDGLLRVGGRLENAPLQLDAKHPIIPPASHQVVCLIISYYHHTSGHSGTEHVLSMIREKFWIVKARAAVMKFLNACFDCSRRQAPIGEQKTANLPKDRITPDKPPFSYVGVDCFGPFLVHCGRSKVKVLSTTGTRKRSQNSFSNKAFSAFSTPLQALTTVAYGNAAFAPCERRSMLFWGNKSLKMKDWQHLCVRWKI